MNLNSLLFGNIDEEGKIENEELDDELKKYLTQFSIQKDTNDLLRQIIDHAEHSNVSSSNAKDLSGSERAPSTVVPLDDAVDYSDIKEEAEEEFVNANGPDAIVAGRHASEAAVVIKKKPDFAAQDFDDLDSLFEEATKMPFEESLTTAEGTEAINKRASSAAKVNEEPDALLPELQSFLEEFNRSKAPKFTSLFLTNRLDANALSGIVVTPNFALNLKKAKSKRKDDSAVNVDLDTAFLLKLPQKDLDMKARVIPKISFKGVSAAVNANAKMAQQMHLRSQRLSATQMQLLRSMEEEARRTAKTDLQPNAAAESGPPKIAADRSVVHNLLAKNMFNVSLSSWESKFTDASAEENIRPIPPYLLQRPYLLPHNWELEKGTWVDCVLTDDKEMPRTVPIVNLLLNMNDPYLLFDRVTQEDISKKLSKAERLISQRLRKLKRAQKAGIPVSKSTSVDGLNSALLLVNPSLAFSKPFSDKFNLSMDRFYESIKDQKGAIQNAFEKVALHHSIPALKLEPPHFKCHLTKSELRCFHRPRLHVSPGSTITFAPLKENKKAKKNKEFGEVIKNSKGITLRDDTPFVLFEFSEETPPLISNSGMASLLQIYYRKRNSKDTYVPTNADLGIPSILEFSEPGPFMGFVDVAPGQEMPVLYNNMFRAPCFRHETPETDFLLVKYTKNKHSTYYLREHPPIFVVGQTFPCIDVYGPHSRKLNAYSRNRIQVAAYRYFQKKDNVRKRVKIGILTSLFPQFSEGTIRKWLKEYADSARQGKDSGYWIMKPNAPTLAEEELQQLVTPENVCQYEAMLFGQQRLIDTGHSTSVGALGNVENDAEDDQDEYLVDDELKLTPWNLTNNFMLATQGKAMLELQGVGDPTGRSEGFSFVKVPLKTQIAYRQSYDSPRKNAANAPKNIPFYFRATQADQQAAYRREIAAIWERQIKALSSPNIPLCEGDFAASTANSRPETPQEKSAPSTSKISAMQPAAASLQPPALEDANAAAVKLIPRKFRTKKLIITRKIACPDGTYKTETETIVDGRIINAYLASKKEKKETKAAIVRKETMLQASNESISKTQLICDSPSSTTSMATASGSRKSAKASNPEKLVKCGACGQLGHMRTNKACPMFKEEAVFSRIEDRDAAALHTSNIAAPPIKLILQEPKPITLKISVPSKHPKDSAEVSSASSVNAPKRKKHASTLEIKDYNPVRRKRPLAELNSLLEKIYVAIYADNNTWPFHKPVNQKYAPNYYAIISNPMDLSLIKSKIINLKYSEASQFMHDVVLMRDNCAKYNGESHLFTEVANGMVETTRDYLENVLRNEIQRAEADVQHETKRYIERNKDAEATGATSDSNYASQSFDAATPTSTEMGDGRSLTDEAGLHAMEGDAGTLSSSFTAVMSDAIDAGHASDIDILL